MCSGDTYIEFGALVLKVLPDTPSDTYVPSPSQSALYQSHLENIFEYEYGSCLFPQGIGEKTAG